MCELSLSLRCSLTSSHLAFLEGEVPTLPILTQCSTLLHVFLLEQDSLTNPAKLSVGGLLQYPRVDECSSIFLYVSSYSHEETEIIHS